MCDAGAQQSARGRRTCRRQITRRATCALLSAVYCNGGRGVPRRHWHPFGSRIRNPSSNIQSKSNPAGANRKLCSPPMPEILKNYFVRGINNLVVTGTHGKTTTTALLAWIMEKAGRKPGYLIGGIPKNFGEGARLNNSKYFVIEGDEYDTAFFDKRSKFIHYLPELLIVNYNE